MTTNGISACWRRTGRCCCAASSSRWNSGFPPWRPGSRSVSSSASPACPARAGSPSRRSAPIEVFRGTPVLIQLIWFFYAFPIVIGVQLTPFVAALLGLTLNTAAYCARSSGRDPVDPEGPVRGRAGARHDPRPGDAAGDPAAGPAPDAAGLHQSRDRAGEGDLPRLRALGTRTDVPGAALELDLLPAARILTTVAIVYFVLIYRAASSPPAWSGAWPPAAEGFRPR